MHTYTIAFNLDINHFKNLAFFFQKRSPSLPQDYKPLAAAGARAMRSIYMTIKML